MVLFNTTHTWVGDVRVKIEKVGGPVVWLFMRPRGDASSTSTVGDSSNLGGEYHFRVGMGDPTIEAQAASNTSTSYVIPSGNYRPARQADANSTTVGVNSVDESYAGFAGLDLDGTYRLTVSDGAGGDTGSIGSWQINGEAAPVPEPAGLAVLGLGAAVLLRRKRA